MSNELTVETVSAFIQRSMSNELTNKVIAGLPATQPTVTAAIQAVLDKLGKGLGDIESCVISLFIMAIRQLAKEESSGQAAAIETRMENNNVCVYYGDWWIGRIRVALNDPGYAGFHGSVDFALSSEAVRAVTALGGLGV